MRVEGRPPSHTLKQAAFNAAWIFGDDVHGTVCDVNAGAAAEASELSARLPSL